MIFVDREHESFYETKLNECKKDAYRKALIYTLGISEITRSRFNQIYNIERQEINPGQIKKAWQTSGTMKITRLAFNLYSDGVPTAYNKDYTEEDFKECRKYSVSDIFCCEYAPYFVQAIQIRYPDYFNNNDNKPQMKGVILK